MVVILVAVECYSKRVHYSGFNILFGTMVVRAQEVVFKLQLFFATMSMQVKIHGLGLSPSDLNFGGLSPDVLVTCYNPGCMSGIPLV